ncbi:hypothetical protein D3C83_246970 [compost metagenome]
MVNTLSGNNGDDVLIGGRYASNTYIGGKSSDICYYRPSDATPSSKACEISSYLP